MFRFVKPQMVEHYRGYQVYSIDRYHIGYTWGNTLASVEVEDGETPEKKMLTIIYKKTLKITSNGNNIEKLNEQYRDAIFQRICGGTQALTENGELDIVE